jgi:hypothetical protein
MHRSINEQLATMENLATPPTADRAIDVHDLPPRKDESPQAG